MIFGLVVKMKGNHSGPSFAISVPWTAKSEAGSHVGKLLWGVQSYSTGWAANASSVTWIELPTPGNLAGASLDVNNFRLLGRR
jgi:hypothetical protein